MATHLIVKADVSESLKPPNTVEKLLDYFACLAF